MAPKRPQPEIPPSLLDDVQAEEVEGTPQEDLAPEGMVREHGELGPVLVDPEADFTGPEDVSDGSRPKQG